MADSYARVDQRIVVVDVTGDLPLPGRVPHETHAGDCGCRVTGFATVDVSDRDRTLTIWLTLQHDQTHVGHTNAVTFVLDASFESDLDEGMLAGGCVVLTDRTPLTHEVLVGWNLDPGDVMVFAERTAAEQAVLSAPAKPTGRAHGDPRSFRRSRTGCRFRSTRKHWRPAALNS